MEKEKIPQVLRRFELVRWDESKAEHFILLPLAQTIGRSGGVSRPKLVRYRVEIRPEGYAVLTP